MGNKATYKSVSEEFEQFPMSNPKASTHNPGVNIQNKKTVPTHTPTLCNDVETLKSKVTKENLRNFESIFAEYDENTVLEYYNTKHAIELLTKNDVLSIKLAQIIPKTTKPLIHKYFPKVPFNILILMKDKLDFNSLNNNHTFLFNNTVPTNIEYVCKLINAIDNLDINAHWNGLPFLYGLLHNYMLDTTDLTKLFETLDSHKYDFNDFGYDRDTFLTYALYRNPKMIFDLANTLRITSFNISIESRWLYFLITKELTHVHNYIYYMFTRDDYSKLFYELYKNLYIDTWGDSFIVFLKKAITVNKPKSIECMKYVDTNTGNTILHLFGQCHDKQTMQFCLWYFKTNNAHVNHQNKTALDMYQNSAIKNVLTIKENL